MIRDYAFIAISLFVGFCTSQSRISTADEPQEPPKTLKLQLDDKTEIELVYIKPGKFEMGRSVRVDRVATVLGGGDGGVDEGPPRMVTITKGFYMGRYKVTCDEYCRFLNSVEEPKKYISRNPFARIERNDNIYAPKPGCTRCSVNTVPWEGANAFCDWLSKKTERTVRLPTEGEWEFAVRGPDKSPWREHDPTETAMNDYFVNRGQYPRLWSCKPVDAFPKDVTRDGVGGVSEWVGEWCSDYYGFQHMVDQTVDPKGPSKEQLPVPSGSPLFASVPDHNRVFRGRGHRWTVRDAGYKARDAGIYGFRIVCETK